jgi:hypothetical protein
VFEHVRTFLSFVSSFEHVNFAINERYSKKNYDNPNYYVFFFIFQTYKNAILRNVHSLGWFFWLWFYPSIRPWTYQHWHICDDLFKWFQVQSWNLEWNILNFILFLLRKTYLYIMQNMNCILCKIVRIITLSLTNLDGGAY